MKRFNSILLAISLMLLQGCGDMKTDETTDPYSITYKETKNIYWEYFLAFISVIVHICPSAGSG